MDGYGIGDFVTVLLADNTIIKGEIVRVGADHFVIDDVIAFGDWVFIEFCNILNP